MKIYFSQLTVVRVKRPWSYWLGGFWKNINTHQSDQFLLIAWVAWLALFHDKRWMHYLLFLQHWNPHAWVYSCVFKWPSHHCTQLLMKFIGRVIVTFKSLRGKPEGTITASRGFTGTHMNTWSHVMSYSNSWVSTLIHEDFAASTYSYSRMSCDQANFSIALEIWV